MPGASTGGVPGETVSRTYGNPGVASQQAGSPKQGWAYTSDGGSGGNIGPDQGRNANNPGEPGGYGPGSGQAATPMNPGNAYGGDPPSGHVNVVGVMQPNRNQGWRGGLSPSTPNDRGLVSDRHIMHKVGNPNTLSPSVPGTPPNPDDPMQGPIQPVFATVNRSLNPQQGSDNTANEDDLSRPYSRNAQGMYVGEQGNGWAPVYGGVPGLYQPYGSYAGYTARDTKGIQSPIEQGSPGDGPHKIFGGPPHGLHSVTAPDYSNTLGRYMSIPQMHAVRVDRPDNSKIAGQDYSQTVQPQGEVGTVSQNPVRFQSRSRFGG